MHYHNDVYMHAFVCLWLFGGILQRHHGNRGLGGNGGIDLSSHGEDVFDVDILLFSGTNAMWGRGCPDVGVPYTVSSIQVVLSIRFVTGLPGMFWVFDMDEQDLLHAGISHIPKPTEGIKIPLETSPTRLQAVVCTNDLKCK